MADTRHELLSAAERLLLTKGLASTREIAREAGCADGTLYNHFKDRTGLYLALLTEQVPDFAAPLRTLPYRAGEGVIADTLEEVGHAALTFYYRVAPLLGALFAEPKLLAAYRAALRQADRGPHLSARAVESYLRVEQRLGRVSAEANPAMAAEILFASCYRRAFGARFIGEAHTKAADRDFIRELVRSMLSGLSL